jgi:hypothetical protein
MINLHDAIYALNSSIVTINGDVAYDVEGNEVAYDKDAAKAKLVEMQTAKESAKQSALAKLAALGLTQDEIKSLL